MSSVQWVHADKNPQAVAHAEAEYRRWPYIIAEHVRGYQGFYYRYGTALSLEAIAAEVLARHKEKRFINEQIHNTQEGGADCPCRVYFDIDGKLKGERSLEEELGAIPTKNVFLRKSLDAIIECLSENYSVTVQYEDFLVSDGSVEDYKYSFHVLLPYKFDDLKARHEFKRQIEDAKAWYWNDSDQIDTSIKAVDEKVYTKNRNMRCLFCAKASPLGNIFRPLNKLDDLAFAPWPEDEAQQILSSLVVNYCDTNNDAFESLPAPRTSRLNEARTRQIRQLDGGTANDRAAQGPSKTYLGTLEAAMRCLLERTHHRGPFNFTWIGDTRVLVKSGPRRCPSGNTHHANRFEIEVRPRGTTDVHPGGLDFFYSCCWTSQACRGKKVRLGSNSAKWQIPRQQYTYEVEGRGAAVRPYPFDKYDTIVECSTCGLGKTLQAQVMILTDFRGDVDDDVWLDQACRIFGIETEGVGRAALKYNVNESIRAILKDRVKNANNFLLSFGPNAERPRVLIIVHRIYLGKDIYYNKNFKGLGFKFYRGATKGRAARGQDDEDDDGEAEEIVEEEEVKKEEAASVFDSDKLIICVNSLHRLPRLDYHLVIIDECEEVFSALTTINARSANGSKWSIYSIVSEIFKKSQKRLLMSAHAEAYTDIFLRHVGEENALWCENIVSKLKDNTYEFYHTFEANDATARIEQYISNGKRLAIPCAERGDVERVHEHLTKTFPHKSFLAVHGALADKEKGAAFDAMTQKRYDAVLYTATVDCGVSVDEIECDIVFARICHRSIRPKQIMQLLHRFRNVVDKLFILSFSCSPRTVDWTRFPGYAKVTDIDLADAETAVVIKVPSKQQLDRQGKQFLFNNQDSHTADLYKVVSGSAAVHLRRNKRPPEASASDVYDHLLRPMAVDMGVVRLKTTVIDEIFAGYPGIQTAIDSGLQGHAPLVAMMVSSAIEKDSLARNMVSELARLVALQGSPMRHCYQKSTLPAGIDVLLEQKTVLDLRKVRAVGNATRPSVRTMRDLEAKKKTAGLNEDETNQHQLGHVVALYGNYDIAKLDDLEAELLETDETEDPKELASRQKALKDLVGNFHACLESQVMKKFRDICFLLKRVDGPDAFRERLEDLFLSRAQSNVAGAQGPLPFASTEDHGKEAENCALLSIAAAFGFNDPLNPEIKK